jgi:transposase
MVHTRRSITALFAGAAWASSTRYLRCWQRVLIDRQYASQSPLHGSEPLKKGDVPRCIGRTKGGLNSKLHAVCDGEGKPVVLLLTEGQTSHYKGAARLLDFLPKARDMIADRGYDADWLRAALKAKGITPCIPPKNNRTTFIPFDADLYRHRHKVENMFAKLKDWSRIATRYDRCAHTFFSAICIAASLHLSSFISVDQS